MYERPITVTGRTRDWFSYGMVLGHAYYWAAFVVLVIAPRTYGAISIALDVMLGLVIFVQSRGAHGWLIHRLGLFYPAPENVQQAVKEIAGEKPPPAFVIDSNLANALALIGTTPCIVFTRRLLEIMDEPQWRSIAAHEIAHLRDASLYKLRHVAWFNILAFFASRICAR